MFSSREKGLKLLQGNYFAKLAPLGLIFLLLFLLNSLYREGGPVSISEVVSGKYTEGEILLVAAGDVMVQHTQLPSAFDASQNRYSFDAWFAEMAPYLHEADIAVANLETTLAGAELEYSGYPAFNSPESLAHDLRQAGFSIVSTANNHCLDRGERGIIRTIEHLEDGGLHFFGTARSPEERAEGTMLNKNGISVAFLAYTYGTNGIPIPDGKTYLVNLIDEEQIEKDVLAVKEREADLIVIFFHWGQEYNRQPTAAQRELAEKVIGWGADLVLGSHPHVLQPVEFVTVWENGHKREGTVVYSLGNFISDQIEPFTDSGLLVRLRYVKEGPGEIRLAEINGVPTWLQRSSRGGPTQFRILPVADALSGRVDPPVTPAEHKRLLEVWAETFDLVWLSPYSLPNAGSRIGLN